MQVPPPPTCPRPGPSVSVSLAAPCGAPAAWLANSIHPSAAYHDASNIMLESSFWGGNSIFKLDKTVAFELSPLNCMYVWYIFKEYQVAFSSQLYCFGSGNFLQ